MFGVPFFFESDAELAHVQEKLTPMIAQRLLAKRYHLINWGNAGWVQLFSKNPIRSSRTSSTPSFTRPRAIRRRCSGTPANGFHVVPLSAGRDSQAAETADRRDRCGAHARPSMRVALQIFNDAPYMLDIRLAPLVGATVMTDAAWNKIVAGRPGRRCWPRRR